MYISHSFFIVFPLFHRSLFQAELDELVKREHALIDGKDMKKKGEQKSQSSAASGKDIRNAETETTEK